MKEAWIVPILYTVLYLMLATNENEEYFLKKKKPIDLDDTKGQTIT